MAHSLAVPSLPAHSSDFLLGFTPQQSKVVDLCWAALLQPELPL